MTPPTDQHREKRVELILQQLEELPTLPAVAVKVLEAGFDRCTIHALEYPAGLAIEAVRDT